MSEAARKPTREQVAVIKAPYPSFVVTAAAGAGKTYVLVERYLRHVLEDGFAPDEILTITFTRKAAAEMKTRIVNALREANRLEDAQTAETGPIQTIHSFCERILRENALEAGLDPEFEILTESAASRLTTECIREALASTLEDEPYAEALLADLAGKRRYGSDHSPYSAIESTVQEAMSKLRGAGASPLELQNRHLGPNALVDLWERILLEQAPEPVRSAFANVEAPTFRERLQGAYRSVLNRVPAWLRGPNSMDAENEAIAHTLGVVQLACAAWWRLEREMDARQTLDFTELERRGVALLERSEETQRRLAEQYRIVMVDEAQDLNPQQYRLLQRLAPHQEMLVGDAQQSIYGFRQADVELFERHAEEHSTLQLSRNHRSDAGILNFVDLVFGQIWSERYRPMNPRGFDLDDTSTPCYDGVELWRHIAKDTDATAHYLRDLLAEGVMAKEVAVLVRDSGFAVELRDALEGLRIPCRIAGGSERYYTRIEIRDLANALRAVADPYDDFALLACLRSPLAGLSLDAVFSLGLRSPVIEALDEAGNPSALPLSHGERDGRDLDDRARRLGGSLDGAGNPSPLPLSQRERDGRDLDDRAPRLGGSLDEAGNPSPLPLSQRERGVDFLSPGDREKLEAFLGWYLPLKAYADRLSAWEVLAEIFARSDYLPALARRERADQMLANARKLLSLASQEPELGPLEYAERIREIQDLRHKEGDAPAGADDADEVTIMTIHKAKGLEFPVVVIPQTFKKLASNAPDLIVEPRQGVLATKFGKEPCLMYKYLADERKQRALEEELRVLYVAMTRAKHRLCICLYAQSQSDSISKRLTPMVKDPLPGALVRDSMALPSGGRGEGLSR